MRIILRCFFGLFSLLFLPFYVLLMPLDVVGYTVGTAESCLRVLLSDTVQSAVLQLADIVKGGACQLCDIKKLE